MNTQDLKFVTVAAVVALGLGLAGCSSSDPDSPTDTDNDTTETSCDAACIEKRVADAVQGEKDRQADEKAATDRKATAKALKKAIADGMSVTGVTTDMIPVIGEDPDATAAITLKKGDAAGMLGSWNGMDYTGMAGTGDSKSTGMVRAYSNTEAAKSVSFLSADAGHGLTLTSDAGDGDAFVAPTDASSDIDGSDFPTVGEMTYTGADRKFSGTFMGASGTYECTSTDDCKATASGDDGITLAGTWTFTPSPGATVQPKDLHYLQFGWWVRKDSKGSPTHADVFYRQMGDLTAVSEDRINNAALQGEATYTGKAAGKFAISDPLNADNDNSGHFTANAKLTADFMTTESTLSGTINTFRLNDDSTDPGWSVALQEAMFMNDGDKFGSDDDITSMDTTVWSIGGNKGAASGSWEAQMYDDKTKDDGSNVPDSVVGKFMSNIGSTHSVVGAFGAEKE